MGKMSKSKMAWRRGSFGGMLETRYYARRENNSQQTCPCLKPTASNPLHQAIFDLEFCSHNAGLYELSVFKGIKHGPLSDDRKKVV